MPVEVAATIAALSRIEDLVGRATRAIVDEGAGDVHRLAQILAPKVSGRLAESITTVGPSPSGLHAWTAEIGPTVVYGRQRELGGHIFPHGHPYLAFFWPKGVAIGLPMLADGRVLVRHVYQHPEPYLKPAADIVRAEFDGIAARHWGAAIRGG